MYFDSHTHLNNEQLYPQRQKHLQDFIQKGWIGLINIGVNHEYNTRWIEIARSFHGVTATIEPVRSLRGKYNSFKSEHSKQESDADGIGVWCTIGLHPYEVVSWDITDSNLHHKLKEMSLLYAPYKECIVAIGECGIDTHYPDSHTTLALQKDLFRQQCDLARQWDLPIVIHSRANRQATHEVLQNFKDLTIYFHCRSYTPDEIKIIKATYPKFYIGFCGNISYPKANRNQTISPISRPWKWKLPRLHHQWTK
jgi:TatD DNase family protein